MTQGEFKNKENKSLSSRGQSKPQKQGNPTTSKTEPRTNRQGPKSAVVNKKQSKTSDSSNQNQGQATKTQGNTRNNRVNPSKSSSAKPKPQGQPRNPRPNTSAKSHQDRHLTTQEVAKITGRKLISKPEEELDDELEEEEDWFDEDMLAQLDEDDFEDEVIEEQSPKRRKIQQTIIEDDAEAKVGFKCGFVTLIGAPNVGKSTLLNRLVGENIAITSYRPQTTRNRIPGVHTDEKAQVIFIDTPGLHEGKSVLSRFMGKIAIDSIADSDVVALLIEAGVGKDLEVGISQIAKQVLESLKDKGKRVFLIVNKIDRIPKEHILPVIAAYRELFDFQEIVPVSGLTGNGIDELIELFTKYLPEGPALYPEDHLTDLPERFFASEMIREQLFRRLSQEVPYATAVTIDSWLDQGAGGIHIEATIHVERDSQKGIIIGKGGQQLKLIGTQARQKIEKLLNTRVHLHLLVRVEAKWTHSEKLMKKLGYEDKK